MTAGFRRLIERPGLLVVPTCYDALSAAIAEEIGFEAIHLGGYALGAHLGVTEPLTTLTETVDAARRITARTELPLIVDADAGFGDPLHTMRTVRELEHAGVAGIHIEDQVFPKRALYHLNYREHTITQEDMVLKIRMACQARRDPDFVIIARTDTLQTVGYEEATRRARSYANAGADMIMLFPRDRDEARRAPRDVDLPLIYVNSAGNRASRPVLTADELQSMGYKVDLCAVDTVLASYEATKSVLLGLKRNGATGLAPEQASAIRRALESTIGLDEHWRVEERTVERKLTAS